MKKNNTILLITTVLCLLPIIISLMVYSQLPEQVAVHFSSNGNPDGYLPKAFAAFGLPAVFALLNVYSQFRRNNDPKIANASAAMRTIATWLIPLLSVIIVPVTLFMSMGAVIPLHIIIPAAAGILIIACGNYLPKSKQNYSVGIKLPWTLNSETNWNKTHRFSGYLWIVGGSIIVIASCLNMNLLPVYCIVLILLVGLPVFYSYLLYKKEMHIENDQ